jgi:hypothetical protein
MFNSPEECCAEILEHWDTLVINTYLCVESYGIGRWDWCQVMPEQSWHARHLLGFRGNPPEDFRAPLASVYLEPPEQWGLWSRKPTLEALVMRLRPQDGS